jgi:hypothetical protein
MYQSLLVLLVRIYYSIEKYPSLPCMLIIELVSLPKHFSLQFTGTFRSYYFLLRGVVQYLSLPYVLGKEKQLRDALSFSNRVFAKEENN